MIKKSLAFVFTLILSLSVLPAQAAITIPGADGSDGALQITKTTVIDLAKAVTGNWDVDNSANAGKGIYDSEKWAVVFKYESVTIDAGSTLSFSNHPSRAPVVWLVSGNVNINGTVNLNGQGYLNPPKNSEPGPGGFRGGPGIYGNLDKGAGFGPGGGENHHHGGSYGTGSYPYGNQSLIPLIGGSGGGAYYRSGGAGGGAILIACQNTLTVNGIVQSNGGDGGPSSYNRHSGGGSGGGIRLVADTLSGSGNIFATGGGGFGSGGLGRIRIERVVNDNTIEDGVVPSPSVINLTSETTAIIWPPDNAPKVRIVSIGDKEPPLDPRASFGTYGADIALPQVSSTQVVVETTNVEEVSQVLVRVKPRFNANFSTVNAVVERVESEDPLIIRWVADLPVNVGYSAVQVKVMRP